MFENLISGEEKQSPIDALLRLLEMDKSDKATQLEMPHIQFMLRSKWLFLRKAFPNKTIAEREEMLLDYYKDLKVSYQGMSWVKIVEGIKEMKPQLMDANIQEGMATK